MMHAGLEQVNCMAWVQLLKMPNNFGQDQWCSWFEINFSDEKEGFNGIFYNL